MWIIQSNEIHKKKSDIDEKEYQNEVQLQEPTHYFLFMNYIFSREKLWTFFFFAPQNVKFTFKNTWVI